MHCTALHCTGQVCTALHCTGQLCTANNVKLWQREDPVSRLIYRKYKFLVCGKYESRLGGNTGIRSGKLVG
jgi:hypothetical protein